LTTAVTKIKQWLSDNDRSMVWLAKQLGTTKQYVYQWLTLGKLPSTKFRVKLNEMFDIKD